MSNIEPPSKDDKEKETGPEPNKAGPVAEKQESEPVRFSDKPEPQGSKSGKPSPESKSKPTLPHYDTQPERIGPKETQDILDYYEAGGIPTDLEVVFGHGKSETLHKLKKQHDASDWLKVEGVWKKKEIVAKIDATKAGTTMATLR